MEMPGLPTTLQSHAWHRRHLLRRVPRHSPRRKPAPQPAALGPIPPLPLRVRMQILRACGAEQRTFCANVPAGQRRIVECLAANGTSLSPGCRQSIIAATR